MQVSRWDCCEGYADLGMSVTTQLQLLLSPLSCRRLTASANMLGHHKTRGIPQCKRIVQVKQLLATLIFEQHIKWLTLAHVSSMTQWL